MRRVILVRPRRDGRIFGKAPGSPYTLMQRPAPAASGPLDALEVPDPVPGDGEVLVEVAACAVCRTDLQLCEGDLEARRLPIVPGHQAVGRVVAARCRTSAGWRVGDRVGGGVDRRARAAVPRSAAAAARTSASEPRSPVGTATAAIAERMVVARRLRHAAARRLRRPRRRAAAVRRRHRLPLAAGRRRRAAACGSGSTASARRPPARSRSRSTGAARSTSCTRSRGRAAAGA